MQSKYFVYSNVNDLDAISRAMLFSQVGLYVDDRGWIRSASTHRRQVFYQCAYTFGEMPGKEYGLFS